MGIPQGRDGEQRDSEGADGRRQALQRRDVDDDAEGAVGAPYRVVGYINPQTNLVEKVETWLEHPFFGDMLIENMLHRVPRRQRRLKFPAFMVQKRVGQPTFELHRCWRRSRTPPTFSSC